MGIETESFENLGKQLEEELETRNFNLYPPEETAKVEFLVKPSPFLLLIRLIFVFFVWVLFSLAAFILGSELFDRFVLISPDKQYFREFLPYVNLALVVIAVLPGLKFFGSRLSGLLRAFFILLNTEYSFSDFFIFLRSGFGSHRARIVPFSTIKSVIIRESFLSRLSGIGDIVLITDSGKVYLHAVPGPKELADKILRKMEEVQYGKDNA